MLVKRNVLRRFLLTMNGITRNPLIIVLVSAALSAVLLPLYDNWRNRQKLIGDRLGWINELNIDSTAYIQKSYRLLSYLEDSGTETSVLLRGIDDYNSSFDKELGFLNVLRLMAESKYSFSLDKENIVKLINNIKNVDKELQNLSDLKSIVKGDNSAVVAEERSKIESLMENTVGPLVAGMYVALIN